MSQYICLAGDWNVIVAIIRQVLKDSVKASTMRARPQFCMVDQRNNQLWLPSNQFEEKLLLGRDSVVNIYCTYQLLRVTLAVFVANSTSNYPFHAPT